MSAEGVHIFYRKKYDQQRQRDLIIAPLAALTVRAQNVVMYKWMDVKYFYDIFKTFSPTAM